MRKLIKAIVILIFVLSLLVGIFPTLLEPFMLYLLYSLIFLFSILSLLYYTKNAAEYKKDKKIILILLGILLTLVIGIIFREKKEPLYTLAFFCMLLSYYSLSIVDIDKNLIKKLSYLVAFLLIPTMIFNGFLNFNMESGVSFSGRLNPLFYLPYILFAIKTVPNKKKFLYWVFVLEVILILIDLWWGGSRIAIASAAIMLITLFIYDRRKFKITNKFKNLLRIVLAISVAFHVFFPSVYLNLSKTYQKELNRYSLSITSKDFFSGRQVIWDKIYRTMGKQDNVFLGTGDVNYVDLSYNPHNDFMGVFYSWGGVVAGLVYLYIFIVGNRCIKNMNNRSDMIVIFSFIAFILCSSNETIMYAPHFFIFEKLLVSNLLNKRKVIA